jgi:dipeptidyl aminopeptidase/acylaminoacyl peptidase
MRLFVLFLLLCFGSNALFAQINRLTPELLWKLGRVSLQDVSPDETTVLYGVTFYDLDENKGNTDLYTQQLDGSDKGVPVRLTYTPASEYNACFHPDGKRILFLRGGLLHEIKLDGSGEKQVSEQPMSGFKLSPDGKQLLFALDIPYEPSLADQHPDLPKSSARIFDGLMYRHWNSWEDGYRSNIFYVGYENSQLQGEPVNIMNEGFDAPLQPFGGMEQINWAPNGRAIAYTCKRAIGTEAAQSTNSDIFLYDLDRKSTRNLSEGMNGYDLEPVFSPNGRYVAWNSMAKPGYEADRNRVFVYDLMSSQRWEMTEGLDRNANHPQWSKDSKKMYFTSEDQGTVQLFEVNFERKGRLRQMTNGFYDYGHFIVTSDNVVVVRASMSAPHEIFRVTLDAGRNLPITQVNKELLAGIKLGEVRKRNVKTSDGKRMLTWVIYPPFFDESKEYPALLYCQGGPQSTVSQFWSYRWNFQMMAANDYIVVAPNRRGLPSFGQAWNDQIAQDWGGQAMQDLLSAIDDVKQEPYVDADRLGAVGASYGGYSVYWLAGNHEKRFKSFISHCGVFNLESWYGTTEELFFANHDMGGPYWDPAFAPGYLRDSPHRYVRNWDTPILVIHGELDFRVPISEGIQAFQAAQLLGIPSRFLYFPDEGHWIMKPQNSIVWQRSFFEWLDTYLK